MSEYLDRYQHVSHQQLYDGVMAGDPGQIDGVAAQWTSLKGILDGLVRELSGDLDKLANTWTGAAGQEFQHRLTLITEYADTLGEGMAEVSRGLTLMAGQLRTAQEQAESPAETDDHDKAMSGAAKGAIFGVPGVVVGGLLGHQQDKAEQEKAHQRMVKVVADLATGYELSAYGRLVPAEPPPPGTPDGVSRDSSTPRSGPGASTPTAAPTASGLSAQTGGATVGTPDRAASGPGSGSAAGAPGAGSPSTLGVGAGGPSVGSSLAGADALVGGALLTGAVGGAAGLGGPGGTAAASAGSGPGLLFGAAAGTPAGGLVGTGALAGSSGSAPSTTPRPTGGAPAAENRSASGVGRSLDGRRAGGNRPGVLGGQGHPDEDSAEERLTWLTEDEMVWRDGAEAAPPVLGTD